MQTFLPAASGCLDRVAKIELAVWVCLCIRDTASVRLEDFVPHLRIYIARLLWHTFTFSQLNWSAPPRVPPRGGPLYKLIAALPALPTFPLLALLQTAEYGKTQLRLLLPYPTKQDTLHIEFSSEQFRPGQF